MTTAVRPLKPVPARDRRADPEPDREWLAHADAGDPAPELAPSAVPASTAAPRFKVWTPEEIWAPLPPPEYAIGGLLLKGNLALICAYGSSLKSWIEIDLLIAKASGERWLELFPCEPSPVLLVDWEADDWEDRRRFQADAKARGIAGPIPGVHMVSLPPFFFTSSDFEATVRELAKTYKLICFDTLSAGSPAIDENDPRFAAGLNILKRIGPEMGCTFVVLHHARKSKTEGGGDEREAVRGSGAIFAACDVVLQLFKREDGSFLVKQTKARGGQAVDPFVVRVENADGGVRVYGVPAEAETDREEGNAATALAIAKRRVLALLVSERGLKSKNQIFRRTKGAKKAVFDAVDDLSEDGIVVVHEGAYRLASEVGS